MAREFAEIRPLSLSASPPKTTLDCRSASRQINLDELVSSLAGLWCWQTGLSYPLRGTISATKTNGLLCDDDLLLLAACLLLYCYTDYDRVFYYYQPTLLLYCYLF